MLKILLETGGVYLLVTVLSFIMILIAWALRAVLALAFAGDGRRKEIATLRQLPWKALLAVAVLLSSLSGALVHAWFPPYGGAIPGMIALLTFAGAWRVVRRITRKAAIARPDASIVGGS